eukprot:INCI5033.11.p1 GENE.INCI5033.11~~INCI5033.11.p1  ORF type:complete len:235 (+),score=45.59 INCI5033.11:2085-2789(+)
MDIMSCCCSKSLPYADVAVVWDLMFLAGRLRCTLGCVLAFLDGIHDRLLQASSLGDLMITIGMGVQEWKQQQFDQATASVETLVAAPAPKDVLSQKILYSIAFWVWRVDEAQVAQSLKIIRQQRVESQAAVTSRQHELQAKINDFAKRKQADLREFLEIPQGRRALLQEALLFAAYEYETLLTFDVRLRDEASTDLQTDVRLWVESMGTSPGASPATSPKRVFFTDGVPAHDIW